MVIRTARRSRRARPRAFTLLELMVVVVILGIIATLTLPRILDRPERARQSKARQQISVFKTALGLFHSDTGRYPTTEEGLEALVKDPGAKGWNAKGYLDDRRVPADPWGNAYLYLSPGTDGRDMEIVSNGRDGEIGGEGFDADIVSWNLEGE